MDMPFTENTEGYRRRFLECSPRLFEPLNQVSLEAMRLVEIGNIAHLESFEIKSPDVLSQVLASSLSGAQHSFYFVPQQFSWGRLRISQDNFEHLLAAHKVFSPFLDCVRAFGLKTHDDHQEWSRYRAYISHSPSLTSPSNDERYSFEICYNLPFAALNGRDRGSPWSLRKIGVHQQFCLRSRRSWWIFLGQYQDTRTQLRTDLDKASGSQNLKNQHPLLLHLVVLSTAVCNWPEYLEHLQDQLFDLDEKACFSRAGHVQQHDYTVHFSDCQNLQLLQHKLLKTASALDSCLDIVQGCEDHCRELETLDVIIPSGAILPSIRAYKSKFIAHRRNLDRILERSHGTSSLLSKILEHRNAMVLQDANKQMQGNLHTLHMVASNIQHESTAMVNVAQKTHKDSVRLKTLTRVATVYLPATLIATIFSSNLVQLQPDDNNRVQQKTHFFIVSQFWIYAVTTMLLTVLTFIITMILDKRWLRHCIKINWSAVQTWAFRATRS